MQNIFKQSFMGHMAHPQSMQSGGTGFQPVHLHRQDAGATKNFSRQLLTADS
jgi:hypothetical protein